MATRLVVVLVPERKSVKNPVHVDLLPRGDLDGEVTRLVALGATIVDDRRGITPGGWVVMGDPEETELCVQGA